MNRYRAYDPFARVYDRHWGAFATNVYPILDHLVLRHLPPGSAVLDLCCGTGQLAAELSRHGYRITGLDGSADMIEIAKRNSPDVDFVLQDARSIDLPRRFSAAFSTYDSLNHIMTPDELEQVFRGVFTILRPGGHFVFDLNMEEGYRFRWRGSLGIVEEDHVFVDRLSYDANERTGRMDCTLFELNGSRWMRTDFPLTQRCYEESEVRKRLLRAGFDEIRSFDRDDPVEGSLHEGSVHYGRMFFAAGKP